MAGAFFGANLRDQITNEPLPIPNDGIGVALLQGDQDGQALPSNAEATFDNVADPPKALVTLAGVNHFGITNINAPSGAIPDPNQQTLDQAIAIETIARWSGLFLRGTMLDDEAALNYVLRTGEGLDPNVSRVEAKAVNEPSSWVGSVSLGVLLVGLRAASVGTGLLEATRSLFTQGWLSYWGELTAAVDRDLIPNPPLHGLARG